MRMFFCCFIFVVVGGSFWVVVFVFVFACWVLIFFLNQLNYTCYALIETIVHFRKNKNSVQRKR